MRQWLRDILDSMEPETTIKNEEGDVVTATYDRSQVEQMLDEISDRFAQNDEMRRGEKAAVEKRLSEARSQAAATKTGESIELKKRKDEIKRYKTELDRNAKDLRDMDKEILYLRRQVEAYESALEDAGIDIAVDSGDLIALDLESLIYEGPIKDKVDDNAKSALLCGVAALLNRRMRLDERDRAK